MVTGSAKWNDTMDASYLLARIIGPYMLIAGLALFINRPDMKDSYQGV